LRRDGFVTEGQHKEQEPAKTGDSSDGHGDEVSIGPSSQSGAMPCTADQFEGDAPVFLEAGSRRSFTCHAERSRSSAAQSVNPLRSTECVKAVSKAGTAPVDWMIEQKKRWLVRSDLTNDWLFQPDARNFLVGPATRVNAGNVALFSLKLDGVPTAAASNTISLLTIRTGESLCVSVARADRPPPHDSG
jgi:hypothetical protein